MTSACARDVCTWCVLLCARANVYVHARACVCTRARACTHAAFNAGPPYTIDKKDRSRSPGSTRLSTVGQNGTPRFVEVSWLWLNGLVWTVIIGLNVHIVARYSAHDYTDALRTADSIALSVATPHIRRDVLWFPDQHRPLLLQRQREGGGTEMEDCRHCCGVHGLFHAAVSILALGADHRGI